MKKEQFSLGVDLAKIAKPKKLDSGFSHNRQPEESETSPHGLQPQYESVRQFQTESKTKGF